MAEFALEYRDAIDKFTECREHKLRELEISADEWDLVEELVEVLKVSWRLNSQLSLAASMTSATSSRRPLCSLAIGFL